MYVLVMYWHFVASLYRVLLGHAREDIRLRWKVQEKMSVHNEPPNAHGLDVLLASS